MSGNRSKSAFFEGGWVTVSADFRVKGASPTNHCWCQKTRVIAVSCGIKIFAVRCLVLSQYTHLTDRRTDGQTDGQTEFRQQYRALHYMQSHGKNGLKTCCINPASKQTNKQTDRHTGDYTTSLSEVMITEKMQVSRFYCTTQFMQCNSKRIHHRCREKSRHTLRSSSFSVLNPGNSLLNTVHSDSTLCRLHSKHNVT